MASDQPGDREPVHDVHVQVQHLAQLHVQALRVRVGLLQLREQRSLQGNLVASDGGQHLGGHLGAGGAIGVGARDVVEPGHIRTMAEGVRE